MTFEEIKDFAKNVAEPIEEQIVKNCSQENPVITEINFLFGDGRSWGLDRVIEVRYVSPKGKGFLRVEDPGEFEIGDFLSILSHMDIYESCSIDIEDEERGYHLIGEPDSLVWMKYLYPHDEVLESLSGFKKVGQLQLRALRERWERFLSISDEDLAVLIVEAGKHYDLYGFDDAYWGQEIFAQRDVSQMMDEQSEIICDFLHELMWSGDADLIGEAELIWAVMEKKGKRLGFP